MAIPPGKPKFADCTGYGENGIHEGDWHFGGITGVSSCNPHKEEDEGYLAAEAGQAASANPYPRGTIRYEEWCRGWQIKANETRLGDNAGYLAADAGRSLSENPHPRGTIRFAEWRDGWQTKTGERLRALRLGRAG
jgi:hypothetical protein